MSDLPEFITDYRFWNTLGVWLASIGTISAVVVSLWLARGGRKVSLSVFAGHRVVIPPLTDERHDCCSVRITNKGIRPVTITGIAWKCGNGKKAVVFEQMLGFPAPFISSPIPHKIYDGEEAVYLIPFRGDGTYPDWITSLAENIRKLGVEYLSMTLKLRVYTSVGKTVEVKVEDTLKKIIYDTARTQGGN